MAVGVHVPWRLSLPWLSQGYPRARLGDGGACTPRLAAGSHLDGQNRPAWPCLLYVAYVCFKCFTRFRFMLQLFYLDFAKVDLGMLHMLQMF
jgi:hypothetical protein